MSKKSVVNLVTVSSVFAVLYATPLVSLAAINNDICGVLSLVNGVATWFGIGVFALATIGILYSAFLFLTSQGDAEKATTAKNVLVYSVIGIAVALLSTNATAIIKATIGGQDFTTACSSTAPTNRPATAT